MKKIQLLVSGIIMLSASTVTAQPPADVEVVTQQINENIYMFSIAGGGNIGVLVGEDGTMIVDDHFAEVTQKIKTAISAIADHPVQFVLNTHFHYDHSDGNENFGADGAIIVAHQNSRERMLTEQTLTGSGRKQAPYKKEGQPKVTFEDAITFHYNGETVKVFHSNSAHTDGDAVVYFQESNVFHTGDVFVRYGLPFIDQENGGDIEGMIDFVDSVVAMANDESVIIPGHGALANRQDMIDFSSMLKTIKNNVQAMIDGGSSLAQVVAGDPLGEYSSVPGSRDAFIKTVYDSLTN